MWDLWVLSLCQSRSFCKNCRKSRVITVYHSSSAVAHFYAPNDLCGTGSRMYRERIRSNPNWRGGYAQRNTMFVETKAKFEGMRGMIIGRALLFFHLHHDRYCSCAIVHSLVSLGNEPDEDTGLGVVQPEFGTNGQRTLAIIHVITLISRHGLLLGYYQSIAPRSLQRIFISLTHWMHFIRILLIETLITIATGLLNRYLCRTPTPVLVISTI